jgi:hypothetical protein
MSRKKMIINIQKKMTKKIIRKTILLRMFSQSPVKISKLGIKYKAQKFKSRIRKKMKN